MKCSTEMTQHCYTHESMVYAGPEGASMSEITVPKACACPRCRGFVVQEPCLVEGVWRRWIGRCLNCGWCETEYTDRPYQCEAKL
jgi:hypothetical protein